MAVDLAEAMLRTARGSARPVLADAVALPFRDASFGLVIAACCLGHLPDPVAALRETRRVGTAVVASAFEAGWTHPAKTAVDDALFASTDSARPPGMPTLKDETEPLVDDPARLAALAAAAGYRDVHVETIRVPAADDPARLAAWRLGMAHVAPFLQALSPAQRAAVRTGRRGGAGRRAAPCRAAARPRRALSCRDRPLIWPLSGRARLPAAACRCRTWPFVMLSDGPPCECPRTDRGGQS